MGLYLLIPTFVVILVSILIVRAGAVALRLTGLDPKTANFQALSAFTRAGFTTRESELVVNHPRRRTIVTWLIVLGNAGIVAVIVTPEPGSGLPLDPDSYAPDGTRAVVDILQALDRPVVDRIVAATKDGEHRFRDLIEQVVTSQAFRNK